MHQKKLANGLQVMAIPFDSPGIVAYVTVVRTGSRNEVEPGHSGFAHFFEHMMFRGTKKHPAGEYNEALKAMGADSNAFTTDDRTFYHIVGPAAKLETMFDLEADRFQNLEYAEDAFRTEAGAVLGEYNKSASNPFQPLDERLRELAFKKHTYKHTTIGFLADIKDMPNQYEYSKSFFEPLLPARQQRPAGGGRRAAGARCSRWRRSTTAAGSGATRRRRWSPRRRRRGRSGRTSTGRAPPTLT